MQRYSVTGLVQEVDALLRARFPGVVVEGEIAELNVAGSGHAFLQLTDEQSRVSAVAWSTVWRALRHRPKVGDKVLVTGRLSIYGARGTFQLYVRDIRPAGLGGLARELAERRARLEAEGLLDSRRKRPLPAFPQHVGVVTALTGAALQDFLRVSGERWPATRVLVAGALVQGRQAPADILRAVELLLEDGRAEILVITRGGGSAQDLMAFQDEQLARILAHSPIPMVSAVGHEIDTTLCDLVADVVVPTPTAAAVRTLPDGPALSARVEDWQLRLEHAWLRTLRQRRERVGSLADRLQHPERRLARIRLSAQQAQERLERLLGARVGRARQAVSALERRLHALIPHRLQRSRRQLVAAQATLDALSPLAVLERGFAVVSVEERIIRAPDQVPFGATLQIRLAEGMLRARALRGSSTPGREDEDGQGT